MGFSFLTKTQGMDEVDETVNMTLAYNNTNNNNDNSLSSTVASTAETTPTVTSVSGVSSTLGISTISITNLRSKETSLYHARAAIIFVSDIYLDHQSTLIINNMYRLINNQQLILE